MLERSSWIISLHLGSSIVNGGSLNAGEEQLDYIPPFRKLHCEWRKLECWRGVAGLYPSI
jgi:hypothetical protein